MKRKNKTPKIGTLRNKDISLLDYNYYTQYILDPYVVPKMAFGGNTGMKYSLDAQGNLIEDPNGNLDAEGNSVSKNTGQSVQNAFDKLPSFQASTKPIIDTLGFFANIYDNQRTNEDEMRMMRRNLMAVNSPNNFQGYDMPLYQKKGGIVVTNYGIGDTSGMNAIQRKVHSQHIPYTKPTIREQVGIN